MKRAWRSTLLLLAMALVTEVSVHDFNRKYRHRPYISERQISQQEPLVNSISNEHGRHLHSILDAYRDDRGGRMVIGTNALIDTKYRAWKRNADLINSLLALPKGLNEAGR